MNYFVSCHKRKPPLLKRPLKQLELDETSKRCKVECHEDGTNVHEVKELILVPLEKDNPTTNQEIDESVDGSPSSGDVKLFRQTEDVKLFQPITEEIKLFRQSNPDYQLALAEGEVRVEEVLNKPDSQRPLGIVKHEAYLQKVPEALDIYERSVNVEAHDLKDLCEVAASIANMYRWLQDGQNAFIDESKKFQEFFENYRIRNRES